MIGKLIFKGIALEIEYDVTKYYPATYETPEEGGDFEIYSVKVEGKYITKLLSEEMIRLIEEQYINEKGGEYDENF